MNHFGIPIQNYLPWNKYDGLEFPTINSELFTHIRDCVPHKFSNLVTLWFRNNGVYITGLAFMESKQIYYSPGSNISWISLSNDSIKFTPESFLDIEKMRLMYLLGIKEGAQEYLKFIDTLMYLSEKIEYYQILIDDYKTGYKINLTNLNKISDKVDLHSEVKFTEKELTDIINDYTGSNSFLNSLRHHLHKKGVLTYNQLRAAANKRNFQDLGYKIPEDKICIELEYAPNREVYDELRTMINRFRLDGYKVLDCNNKTIIY